MKRKIYIFVTTNTWQLRGAYTMKLTKKMQKIAMALLLAVLVAMPSALAVGWTHPTQVYGQPRIGSYTTTWAPHQGMFNYVSSPIYLSRYGAQWHVNNVRLAAYPSRDHATYMPQLHAPYLGYPYNNYGHYGWETMRWSYWNAR